MQCWSMLQWLWHQFSKDIFSSWSLEHNTIQHTLQSWIGMRMGAQDCCYGNAEFSIQKFESKFWWNPDGWFKAYWKVEPWNILKTLECNWSVIWFFYLQGKQCFVISFFYFYVKNNNNKQTPEKHLLVEPEGLVMRKNF